VSTHPALKNASPEVQSLVKRLERETRLARAGLGSFHEVKALSNELDALLAAERRAANPGIAERIAARRADRKF
jgi:hypothetical protein